MKRNIYVDNAATTRLDPDAFEAMKPYLLDEYGNPSQPYSFSRTTKKAVKAARETIAELIGAEPDEIVFTSGGTESDNWAIKGVAAPSSAQPSERREIVTSAFEHKATLNSCAALERFGVPVAYLRPNERGFVEPKTLRDKVSERTKLVSIMSANNEIGTLQPIRELCEIAHENGALFHTDAVQTIGRVRVDVRETKVDLLSASAHKFNGPSGIGFLYVRRGTPIVPLLDGGSQERGLRGGTENVAAIVGAAVALKNNCEQMEEISKRVREIERLFLATLTELLKDANVRFRRNGDGDAQRSVPGIVNLSFLGANGEALLHRLDLAGIAASTGAACDGSQTKISPTLQAIGVPEKYAVGTLRLSFGGYNKPEDAIYVAEKLAAILKTTVK